MFSLYREMRISNVENVDELAEIVNANVRCL